MKRVNEKEDKQMLGNFAYCNPTKLYFGEDSLQYLNTELPMPPSVPFPPCVDSCIAYDNFAEAVESIHDVFLVCFCASHRKIPPFSHKGHTWFIVAFL